MFKFALFANTLWKKYASVIYCLKQALSCKELGKYNFTNKIHSWEAKDKHTRID